MTRQVFNDRFILSSPGLAGVDIDNLTDAQLESMSADFKDMSQQVKRFSVLLRKKPAREVYHAITEHADAQIALVLAAALDASGNRMFPDLDKIKSLMFGPPDDVSTQFLSQANNIFVQGIRRVSAALAASTLIGQLAQIPEQAQHSFALEKQAFAELDRIISIPDIQTSKTTSTTSQTDVKAFYIEDAEFVLGSASLIKVEVYLSASLSSAWEIVGTYSGKISTADLVVALADSINSSTLVSNESKVLAAPVLSSLPGLHAIEFSARTKDATIATELVSVRFTFTLNTKQQPLPFKWGVNSSLLRATNVNSVLLAVGQGKVASATATSQESHSSLNVLYFKRAATTSTNKVLDSTGKVIDDSVWQNGVLTYRVSPRVVENTTVSVPYLSAASTEEQIVLDKQRPSEVAVLLLNELFKNKGTNRALGSIIRNDEPTSGDALVAMELVAFSVTNPETWIVLDILELPADILIAVGDENKPITPFSNKPRSIRVSSRYEFNLSLTSADCSVNIHSPYHQVVRMDESELLHKFRNADRRIRDEILYYPRSSGLPPAPPTLW